MSARNEKNGIAPWLLLPPSEEEIEAAAIAIAQAQKSYRGAWTTTPQGERDVWLWIANAALLASRAVLVPPPEVAR